MTGAEIQLIPIVPVICERFPAGKEKGYEAPPLTKGNYEFETDLMQNLPATVQYTVDMYGGVYVWSVVIDGPKGEVDIASILGDECNERLVALAIKHAEARESNNG